MPLSLPRVAISLGDPAGIGPEIALKAALDPRVRGVCRPLIVGDPRALAAHARASGLAPRVRSHASAADVDWSDDGVGLLALEQFGEGELAIGEIRAAHGRAAVEAARAAIATALQGHVEAVVAAPQTELAIKAAGIEFDGIQASSPAPPACRPRTCSSCTASTACGSSMRRCM